MSKYKKVKKTEPAKKLEFKALLEDAITLNGELSKCYSAFHNYSFSNQILAMAQIGAQPINTFRGWQDLGRSVKEGEKAIQLVMPVTCKSDEIDENGEPKTFTRFMIRNNWFGLNQTQGFDFEPEPVPGFDKDRVLSNLNVPLMQFESMSGNMQGYTDGKAIAINPVAKYPTKTLFHELGHILLGHVAGADTATMTRSLKEVEAESVAYLMSNIFNLDQEILSASRGYIQIWNKSEGIPEESAKRIIKAVGQILTANKGSKESE